jgi:hypothetical protein
MRWWELSKWAHRPRPGHPWGSEHAASDRGGASKGGASWEYVVCDEERKEGEDFDDGCGAHAHFMYSHFMYETQADRRMDVYNEVAERVKRLVHKDAASYSRSSMRQQQILKSVQAESPFCWQPLPKGCAVIDTWISVGKLVCIAKRCALRTSCSWDAHYEGWVGVTSLSRVALAARSNGTVDRERS